MSKRLFLVTSEAAAPILNKTAGRGSGTSRTLFTAKACPSSKHMTSGR